MTRTVPQYSPILQTDLGNVYGILYIAAVLSTMLFGVTCSQTFVYFQSENKDRLVLKLLVLLLLFLGALHQAFAIYTGYFYLILNFGDVFPTTETVWSNVCTILSAYLITILVQWFYAHRLYTLSNRSVSLFMALSVLMLAELVICLIFITKMFIEIGPTGFGSTPGKKSFIALVISFNALNVATDLLIAFALWFYLQRNKSGIEKTESVINRLILYTISTGFITSIDVLLALITLVVIPQTYYYVFFTFLIPSLHCNSALAMLNIRGVLRNSLLETSVPSLPTVMFRQIHIAKSGKDSSVSSTSSDVEVDHDRFQASHTHTFTTNDDTSEKFNGSNLAFSQPSE